MEAKIDLKEAMSIGIGGMVGGGIFAVLGLAVGLAKGGTPISFLIAGLIALLTSYSYVKLSLVYSDRGGTVRFINEGYGVGVFSGGANNLLWVSYIIMLSLYASAFGSYAPNLWQITSNANLNFHLYASSIIIIATIINYYSANVVSKIESIAVVVKLVILLFFILVGLYGLTTSEHLNQLAPSSWESPLSLLAGGMVIFVAYEGFELIANAVPDIKNPSSNIPKAYYGSIIFVIILYVIIAGVTVGSLGFDTIKDAEDYVLAEAAKPILGQIGFTIITIAALISTFSAINASLYGGSRVNYEIAEKDELPHQFTYKFWNHPVGLAITAILTLLMVNTLELESISTAGSVGFLLVFAIVNSVGFKLSNKTKGNAFVPALACVACLVAIIVMLVQHYSTSKLDVFIALGVVVICFVLEFIYKKIEQKS
ncbi:APC family permease [Aureispira sp. CCB-E]|uniref:APC family permease n=1 Tax=Aureispira sp. CCB-E TaxID=3051121 RepID=UPI0028686D6E|nr:APC family permease [Aureispira sp. CCB-E]WMX16789.1 APC family permease [Aureispira sp. CCB-E]